MAFADGDHLRRVEHLNKMWDSLVPLSEFADRNFGIDDIFQDNDGKVMQQLTLLDFDNVHGREGNDGKDENGVEWEMKSVNINKTYSISTHHHLNTKIIEKYRKVPWTVAVYEGVNLMEIYAIHPKLLDDEYFIKWERIIVEAARELNNPKLNLDFIKANGLLVYKDKKLIKDPKSIYDAQFMKENTEFDFSTSKIRAIEEILGILDTRISLLTDGTYDKRVEEGEDIIEYAKEGIGFLKIIKRKQHLNICLKIKDFSNDEDLEPTKGKERFSYVQGFNKYNCKCRISNKKIPIDRQFELIIKSYNKL